MPDHRIAPSFYNVDKKPSPIPPHFVKIAYHAHVSHRVLRDGFISIRSSLYATAQWQIQSTGYTN